MTETNNIKVVFMGTPDFAAKILQSLIDQKYQITAVLCEPDAAAGRGQNINQSAVKTMARKYNLPLFQPKSLIKNADLQKKLTSLKPDLIIVAAYGKIIPQEILDIPKFKSVNVHGSLLPKYRGASPISTAILSGDKETGITIMLMDAKMDHGPILSQESIPISDSDTTTSLTDKMADLGAQLLIKTISGYTTGKIKPKKQDHAAATFVKMIKKQDGQIDWNLPAAKIERMIRAYAPWPGTFAFWNDKLIKIKKARVSSTNDNNPPSTVFKTDDRQLAIACGQDALLVETIQLEGKKETTGKDFINGFHQILGQVLKKSC